MSYSLPGLVFEEWPDDGVESMDVPGLIHEVDPSKSGRKTVLFETNKTKLISVMEFQIVKLLLPTINNFLKCLIAFI